MTDEATTPETSAPESDNDGGVIIVKLGNTAPLASFYKENEEGERVHTTERLEHDRSVTTYKLPAKTKLVEAVTTITSSYNVHHSEENPAWVESNHDQISQALAEHYDATENRPEDWDSPEDEY